MLLLVVHSQNDAPCCLPIDAVCKEVFHGLVHMCAKRGDFIQRRSRKRTAQVLLRHGRAKRVVITVEEPAKLFAKGLITRIKGPQHKRLKKPSGMRLMPFRWASVRAR